MSLKSCSIEITIKLWCIYNSSTISQLGLAYDMYIILAKNECYQINSIRLE
jgi:hypothetical protein